MLLLASRDTLSPIIVFFSLKIDIFHDFPWKWLFDIFMNFSWYFHELFKNDTLLLGTLLLGSFGVPKGTPKPWCSYCMLIRYIYCITVNLNKNMKITWKFLFLTLKLVIFTIFNDFGGPMTSPWHPGSVSITLPTIYVYVYFTKTFKISNFYKNLRKF